MVQQIKYNKVETKNEYKPYNNKNLKTKKKSKSSQKHTKKGGNPLKFIKYKIKNSYRWLFRKRANIFDIDTFRYHREVYLRTLFIYLRYRTKIAERNFRETIMFWKQSKPALSKKILPDWLTTKNPLKDALDALHTAVTNSIQFNNLSLSNKVALKNGLCIATVDSLKNLYEIQKSKDLAKIIHVLAEAVISCGKSFQNDSDFANRFRPTFDGFTKLNFRMMNTLDYGFCFNFFYYGPYFHERIHSYDNNPSHTNKVKDNQILAQKLLTELLKTFNDKRFKHKNTHLFPDPRSIYSLESKDVVVNKILEVDALRQKREFVDGKTPDGQTVNRIYDTYYYNLEKYNELKTCFVHNDIDNLNGCDILKKDFKDRVQSIYESYSKDTEGLTRQQGNVSRNYIDNVDGFRSQFVEQMESCSHECSFIHFKYQNL